MKTNPVIIIDDPAGDRCGTRDSHKSHRSTCHDKDENQGQNFFHYPA
ncbi:MAG TPA: hypothetical protein VFG19_14905 [Geobacteraceae bacterium]|nr:hypothetical protein [Geobacteraceae bacterium]